MQRFIHDSVSGCADRLRDRTALVGLDAGVGLTYAELVRRAGEVAEALRGLGVGGMIVCRY